MAPLVDHAGGASFESMNDKTLELLEKLSAKLGTTSEFLWGVLVKQAKIEAITSALWAVIFFAATVVCLFACRFFWKGLKKYPEEFGYLFGSIITCFLLVIFVAISANHIETCIVYYFNPDYFALNKILKILK